MARSLCGALASNCLRRKADTLNLHNVPFLYIIDLHSLRVHTPRLEPTLQSLTVNPLETGLSSQVTEDLHADLSHQRSVSQKPLCPSSREREREKGETLKATRFSSRTNFIFYLCDNRY